MTVEVAADKYAEAFFKDRLMAASRALAEMEGVKDANIALQRTSAAGDVESYSFRAECEATSMTIAGRAMEAALKTLSEGLMHIIRRAPVAEHETDFLTGEEHFIGHVRAQISNQQGDSAAAQRGGPDVV